MDKKECLEALHTTVMEFISDVNTCIAKGLLEKKLCEAFFSYFKFYSRLKLMNKCVTTLLPHKENIEKKNIVFIETELPVLFKEITGQEFPINLKERVGDTHDMEMIWNYLSMLVILTEQYKKDQ